MKRGARCREVEGDGGKGREGVKSEQREEGKGGERDVSLTRHIKHHFGKTKHHYPKRYKLRFLCFSVSDCRSIHE